MRTEKKKAEKQLPKDKTIALYCRSGRRSKKAAEKERIKSKYTKNGQFKMTYEDYIAQENLALEEEQADDQCFLTNQPEGQFVRGH